MLFTKTSDFIYKEWFHFKKNNGFSASKTLHDFKILKIQSVMRICLQNFHHPESR